MISKIRPILLFLLAIMMALTYHPAFSVSVDAGGQSVSTISKYVYLLVIVLSAISYSSSFFKLKFARTYIIQLTIIVIMGLLFSALGMSSSYLKNIIQLAMPLLFVMLGYSSNLSSQTIKKLVILFSLGLVYVGTCQIMTGLGGFEISAHYLSFNKNGLGAMLMSSALVVLVFFLNSTTSIERVIYLAVLLMLLVVDLTVRARGAFLAFIIAAVIILCIRVHNHPADNKQIVRLIVIGSILLIVIPLILDPAAILGYLKDALFMNHEGDFTSGRTERNQLAWSVFNESPLFGLMATKQTIPWVHNFLLLQLSNFGIIGSSPIIVLYIYIFFYAIHQSVKYDASNDLMMGFFVILFLFLISLGEPTLPFSPGTAVFLPFFLLGRSICISQNNVES